MKNKIINRIKVFIEIKKRRFGAKLILHQIDNVPDEEIIKIKEVFNFFIDKKKWAEEEIEAFVRVEELRKKYLASSETITIKDFGAGESASYLTKEQMNNGVEIKRIISDVCKSASTPEKWCKIIFKIIRTFQPGLCLELGTSLGISAAYQIIALKLNKKGKLITFDGAVEVARIAEKNLRDLQYSKFCVHFGKFHETLPKILPNEQPIDFALIDGHHDKCATKEYFEQIYPYLSHKSILIFDDINWSKGMREVWEDLYQDKRIKASFDMYKWGICLIDKEYINNEIKYYKISV